MLTARASRVKVWDVQSGAEVATGGEHPSIPAAAFSPDAEYFVTGDKFGWLKVYETQTGEKTFEAFLRSTDTNYRGIPPGIWAVAFSPQGDRIAAKRGCDLVVYDLTLKEEIARLHTRRLSTYVAFFPDGRRVFGRDIRRGLDGYDHNTGIVWNFTTGEVVYFQGGLATLVDEGREVITTTSDWDGSNRVGTYVASRWDANTRELKSTSPEFITSDGGISFSPSGDMVFVKEEGKTVGKLVDLQTGASLRRFDPPGDGEIGMSCFSPDGKRLVTVSGDTAYLWDISDLVTAVENAALYDQKE